MSALPIIPKQNSVSVGLFTHFENKNYVKHPINLSMDSASSSLMRDAMEERLGTSLRAELRGRRRHLGNLALKFFHRGASWDDLGRFLKDFFEEQHFKGVGFSVQECRHNGPSGYLSCDPGWPSGWFTCV